MHHQPLEITYEIELNPGERLALPDALVASIGPGRWMITVQSLPPVAAVRDHSALLRGYAPEDEGLYEDCATR